MLIAAIILAAVLILALLRVGAVAEFSEDGLIVKARVGPFALTVYSSEGPVKTKKKEKPKKKAKQKVKVDKKKEEEPVKPGLVQILKSQLPAIGRTLSRFKRRLLINELTIFYLSAGEDAAQTAMIFGAVSAGYGFVISFLENNFRIRKRDLRTAVDFQRQEPYIYIKAHFSLAIWEIVYIAIGLLKIILLISNKKPKIRKAV